MTSSLFDTALHQMLIFGNTGFVGFPLVLAVFPEHGMVPILVSKNGHEGSYAAGVTAVTLAVSVVSIPLVMLLI